MSAASSPGPVDDLPRSRITGAFERRVARLLDAHLRPHDTVVVATSGGPDSTAALVATARVRAEHGAPVVAACFDHRMRPRAETQADRAFVQELAQRLGIPAETGEAHDGSDARSEAEARAARYGWLAGVCARAGAPACVTGHTMDDQAETVLLRMVRGAGTAGMAGMAEAAPWPVPSLPAHGLIVLRPLLGFTREQVLYYLDALEIEAREDETNELLTFDRNRVRHRVLGELRSMNPRVAERIARLARLAREDEEALDAWARKEFEWHVEVDGGGANVLRRSLRELPPAVSSRVLRLAAQAAGLQLDGAQADQLLGIAARGGARASLAGGEAWTDAERLRIERRGTRETREG